MLFVALLDTQGAKLCGFFKKVILRGSGYENPWGICRITV
jgi:hypothetical protein